MDSLTEGGRYSNATQTPKEMLVGKVVDVKSSAERGRKRLIVRDSSGRQSAHHVEIPMKEMHKIERSKSYEFLVEEKEPVSELGRRPKQSGGKHYICDDPPQPGGLKTAQDKKNEQFGFGRGRTQFPKGI